MIRKLAEHAGFGWIMDRGTLAITPVGQARPGPTPLVAASTIMNGYPIFVSNTLVVKTLFNPNIGTIEISKFKAFWRRHADCGA